MLHLHEDYTDFEKHKAWLRDLSPSIGEYYIDAKDQQMIWDGGVFRKTYASTPTVEIQQPQFVYAGTCPLYQTDEHSYITVGSTNALPNRMYVYNSSNPEWNFGFFAVIDCSDLSVDYNTLEKALQDRLTAFAIPRGRSNEWFDVSVEEITKLFENVKR